MRFLILLAGTGLSLLAFVALLGLPGGNADAQTTTNINAGNFYFCDDADQGKVCETTIAVGDTVTWKVEEGTHTVTQCDAGFSTCPPAGGFNSGSLSKDATFSQTFTSPGVIPYHCNFHPTQMMGRLTVAAAQATATPAASPSSPAATAAKLPASGGPPSDSGSGVPWAMLLAVLGVGLVAGSAVADVRSLRQR